MARGRVVHPGRARGLSSASPFAMPAIPSSCAGFSLTATCTSASPSLQAVTARPPSTPTSPTAISSCTLFPRRGRFRPRSMFARLGRNVRSDVSRTAKRQERDFGKRSRCANVVSSSEPLVPDSICGNSPARIHLNISEVSTVPALFFLFFCFT